jgi:TolA-binding protein
MQAFLNALWLFGHDPESTAYTEGILKNASRLGAPDAAMWAANIHYRLLEGNSKSSGKHFQSFTRVMEEVGDACVARGETQSALEAYEFGVKALDLWRRRVPRDQNVERLLRNLSTKFTILKGKYQDGDSFRESISDADEQADLHDMDRSVQSDRRLDELVDKLRLQYEAAPDQPDAVKKYADILCRREREEEETTAIGVLVEAYKRSGAYRWKQRADEIRIKQLSRQGRLLAQTGDEEALKTHLAHQRKYELGVYRERFERYPTDLRVKYEYGLRLFRAGHFDDAIPVLQSARNEPKNRASCCLYLGRCFYRKGFHTQAVQTLREALNEYESPDDEVGKELLYWLGRCQEEGGELEGARQSYGQLLQVDYNYRDGRARLEGLPQAG